MSDQVSPGTMTNTCSGNCRDSNSVSTDLLDHGARHTYAFEDTVAWWTARAASSTVAEFPRTTWRAVQAIVERVVTERAGQTDLLWDAEGARQARRWFAKQVADQIATKMGARKSRSFLDQVSAFEGGISMPWWEISKG
jgi:hypothetical protein